MRKEDKIFQDLKKIVEEELIILRLDFQMKPEEEEIIK